MLDISRNQTLGTVDCGEAVLKSLQSGMLGESTLQNLTFSVNGALAYPTAVVLQGGSVVCLLSNMDSSIPAEDIHGIPRADGFYHGEGTWKKPDGLDFETAKNIVGVAAYRLVQSPGVVAEHEARVAEAVS